MAYSALEEQYGRKFYEQDALLENTNFKEVIIFRQQQDEIPPRNLITMTLRNHAGTELLSWPGTKVVMRDSQIKAVKTFGECQLSHASIGYLSVLRSGVVWIDKDCVIDRLTTTGTVYIENIESIKREISLFVGGRLCINISENEHAVIAYLRDHLTRWKSDKGDSTCEPSRKFSYTYFPFKQKYEFTSILEQHGRVWVTS